MLKIPATRSSASAPARCGDVMMRTRLNLRRESCLYQWAPSADDLLTGR